MVSVLSCFGRAGVSLHVVFRFGKIGILDQALQNFYKLRTGGSQFFQMVQRKCLEKLFAVASQLDENLPAVVGAAQAAEQAALDQTVDQFHRAVMLELHPFGQNSDGRFKTLRQTANREQQLMLLRLDASFTRCVFAETQEATDLIAKFRHGFEIG
ncbi:MAG TPA: hypothetical protein VMS25_12615 [Candidatus Limnocylindrales bacterium]|nr:hypothetical protein [Candidatus Limnocylindrales bacterium]